VLFQLAERAAVQLGNRIRTKPGRLIAKPAGLGALCQWLVEHASDMLSEAGEVGRPFVTRSRSQGLDHCGGLNDSPLTYQRRLRNR
jgi:hypothetical protein